VVNEPVQRCPSGSDRVQRSATDDRKRHHPEGKSCSLEMSQAFKRESWNEEKKRSSINSVCEFIDALRV